MRIVRGASRVPAARRGRRSVSARR
jgi:hypothetical protein